MVALTRCRRSLVTATLFAALAALSGCGGGGGSDLPAGRVRASIKLPAGSSLAMADLKVAAHNASSVDASGGFTFDGAGSSASMVAIGDAQDHPLLAGFAEPGDTGPVTISSSSTALTMLFIAVGGHLFPADQQKQIRSLIQSHAAFAPFAAVVAARLGADPRAISAHDAALFAALDTAVAAMGASGSAPVVRGLRRSTKRSPGRDEPILVSQLLAQPSETQSGLIVASSDDLTGLQVTNTRRRHLLMYVKQVGYRDQHGVDQKVDIDLADGSFPRWWVPSTNKLSGAIGSTVDVIVGNGAYQPYSTEPPMPLPINPATAQKCYYKVILVGPGGYTDQNPTLGKLPYWVGGNDILAFSIFKDLFLPLLFTALDSHLDLDHLANPGAMFTGIRGMANILGNGGHVAIGLTSGEPKELILGILKTLADDPAVRQLFLNALSDMLTKIAPDLAGDIVARAGEGLATKLNLYLAIIDKAMGLGDAAVAAHDMAASRWFEEWGVTAIPPVVHLQPGDSTVVNLDSLLLTVQTPVKGELVYHWKTSGKYGHLLDTKGHSGMEFDSTDEMLNYVGDSTPATGQTDTDTVTVTAYIIPSAGATRQRLKVNSATVTLTRKKQEQYGQATVNILDAVDGSWQGGGTDWAKLVSMGERKYSMVSATKSPSSLGQFINSSFATPGVVNSAFLWHGHVPSIAPGVTVPAAPPGFVGSLDLYVPYTLNGTNWRLKFTAYEGTITITGVSGNLITFEATSRMEWDPETGYLHTPGQYGHIDVTISGHTTLVDEGAAPGLARPQRLPSEGPGPLGAPRSPVAQSRASELIRKPRP